MLKSIKEYLTKNNINYKLFIAEQNDDKGFNRGAMLNVAFLEAETRFPGDKRYMHMNVDYEFHPDRAFPPELLTFKEGFLDVFRFDMPILGSACAFTSDAYRLCNGFPNDLFGWGGDDWAIYKRIMEKNIPILMPPGIHNSGLVFEHNYDFRKDQSNNIRNIQLSKRADTDTNGVNSCKYTIEKYGEFHDGDTIFHLVVNL